MIRKNVPNLFLIGAPKCGTTALATQLAGHPEIFLGKKEPRYFDARTFFDYEEDWPIKNMQEYLTMFDSELAFEARYRVDASVFNMYSEGSIKDILALNPDAKFIMVLRNPLTAAKSMHRQRLKYVDPRMREVSTSFEDCWRILEKRKVGVGFPDGCRNKFLFRYDLLYSYEKYIPFISKLVDKKNIIYISYDDFLKAPATVYDRICHFLGILPFRVESIIVNPSDVIKLDLKNKFIFILRRYLSYLSRNLGLSGASIAKIASALLRYDRVAMITTDSHLDEEILEYFKDSIIAMNNALNHHSS